MRVVWVVYDGLSAKTGGTLYDACILQSLRARGTAVEVVALERGRVLREALRLVSRVRQRRPEVLIGDELCFRELALAFGLLRASSTCERWLLVHHLTAWETERPRVERWRARWLEGRAIAGAERIVTTSETTKRRLLSEHRPRAPIAVVPPGADRLRGPEHATREPRRSDTKTRFLFLGSITRRKRVLELVHAFDDAERAGGILEIVGGGGYEPEYARHVEAAVAARSSVSLRGELDDDHVRSALLANDVLVMPSSLEGWGMAATEALAFGTPVIAARSPGLEEALADAGEAAWLIDPSDLASALRRFVTEPELRDRMTRAASAGAHRARTWSEAGDRFRALLGP